MTNHPEETLSLVRLQLWIQKNVFGEQIIRNLETPVPDPVLGANLMETPESEITQRKLGEVIL